MLLEHLNGGGQVPRQVFEEGKRVGEVVAIANDGLRRIRLEGRLQFARVVMSRDEQGRAGWARLCLLTGGDGSCSRLISTVSRLQPDLVGRRTEVRFLLARCGDEDLQRNAGSTVLPFHLGPGPPQQRSIDLILPYEGAIHRESCPVDLASLGDLAALPLDPGVAVPEDQVLPTISEDLLRELDSAGTKHESVC